MRGVVSPSTEFALRSGSQHGTALLCAATTAAAEDEEVFEEAERAVVARAVTCEPDVVDSVTDGTLLLRLLRPDASLATVGASAATAADEAAPLLSRRRTARSVFSARVNQRICAVWKCRTDLRTAGLPAERERTGAGGAPGEGATDDTFATVFSAAVGAAGKGCAAAIVSRRAAEEVGREEEEEVEEEHADDTPAECGGSERVRADEAMAELAECGGDRHGGGAGGSGCHRSGMRGSHHCLPSMPLGCSSTPDI